MSSTPTRCIALTGELDASIRTRVASGQFARARAGVRAARHRTIEREATILGGRPAPSRITGEPAP
ncbi:type II toxin-antitoxin system ParD family antitoxin [Methylobacterium sp. J-068]|uniref:type II toxin-antitoxin system ParD family antitoxin n=1 Tax=Methylobacterium sp. J-068 TaxID=2836649 RepID=UPI001FB88CAB|nr:type II toxin-antitoxin system ParD family antitoxin [Methylobacterium sp. J-068]MCJ2035961.1 type II toxin-antitoxin system ParD family antitoxin [Methylobacterium sp. J-068]